MTTKSTQYQIATQTYVWIQNYQSQNKQITDHLDTVLDEIQQAGISIVEGWLDWFADPQVRDQLKLWIQQRQLQLPALYHNSLLHDPDKVNVSLDEVYELAGYAQELGTEFIVCNPIPIDWTQPIDKSDAQLKIQADALNTLGEGLQKMGMKLAVHHHDAEMRNAAKEFLHIVDNTNPQYVGFCLDFDWISRGKQSPLDMLYRVGDRLIHAHIRNSNNGRWTFAVEDGDTDYHLIHKQLQEIDYKGMLVIELAYEKDMLPVADIGKHLEHSLKYVKSVFEIT